MMKKEEEPPLLAVINQQAVTITEATLAVSWETTPGFSDSQVMESEIYCLPQ